MTEDEMLAEAKKQFEAIEAQAPAGLMDLVRLHQQTAEVAAQTDAYLEMLNPTPRFTVVDHS